MSIAGRSIDIKSISCVTAITLYNSIVIQHALYGCELWSNVTNTDIEKMEVGHRFYLKVIQSVTCRSRSVVVESMANSYSIRVIIDVKKLLFQGRLCRLQFDSMETICLWSACSKLIPQYYSCKDLRYCLRYFADYNKV